MRQHRRRTVNEAREVELLREKWLAHIASTEPAERKRAEEGVRLTYRAAGVQEPEFFLWFDGLLEAALAAEQLAGGSERNWLLPATALRYRKRVQQDLRRTLGVRAWPQVINAVGTPHERYLIEQREVTNSLPFGRRRLGLGVAAKASSSLQAGLPPFDPFNEDGYGESPLMSRFRMELDAAGSKLFEQQRQLFSALMGPGASGHSSLDSLYPVFRRDYPFGFLAVQEFLAGRDRGANSLRYEGLWTTAQTCAAWWPFAHAAVLADRPQVIHLNSEMELQNDHGPAVLYRSGLAVYAPIA